jgi:hypothetical protein
MSRSLTKAAGRLRPWLVRGGLLGVATAAAAASLQAPVSASSAPAVCGGLRSDAEFRAEVRELGSRHACAHLSVRAGRRAHHHGLGEVGTLVRGRVQTAAAVAGAAARPPSVVGRWSAAQNPGTTTMGITAVLLHTGDVLLLGDKDAALGVDTSGFLYDPETGRGRDASVPAPIFCGSVTPLSDGRILSAGGSNPFPRGIRDLWLFDPVAVRWVRQPDMVNGRYYPTGTRLPDGRVVITAGRMAVGGHNPDVELFTRPRGDAARGRVRVVGENHLTTMYPHQVVMPDGRMLQVEERRSFVLDPADWSWRRWGTALRQTGEGSAHLVLPAGPRGPRRVMVMGGQIDGTARSATEVLTYGRRKARWSRAAAMPTRRAHMNVVQAPDGSAYVIGGNSEGLQKAPKRRTMRYDPATGRWRNLAAQAPRRAYHSTALLLPDGRIMSAGDNVAGGGQALVDFYSPPYLFQGPRPRITRMPRHVSYRQRFSIRSAGPLVTRAVLMAPAATTHANDMNARHVELAVRRTPRGLRATAPRRNVAPPGYYMLFVLRPSGVPSVARWVRLTG